MKRWFLLLSCFAMVTIQAQSTGAAFDGHKWGAPYHLPIPAGWTIERFQIPIVFAPGIPYSGVEDIRFTPGWADKNSDQYWTYAFLWFLDGAVSTNAETVESQLREYYTGLLQINKDSGTVSKQNLAPVKTIFNEIPATGDDKQTFSGMIEMIDYMQLKPLTLHCVVHLKTCPGLNKTLLFYQLSPKPTTHGNWQLLNELWTGFNCKKS